LHKLVVPYCVRTCTSLMGTGSILDAFLAVVRIIRLVWTESPLPDISCNVLVDRLESVLHSQEMGL
jgi:hypothetical protein